MKNTKKIKIKKMYHKQSLQGEITNSKLYLIKFYGCNAHNTQVLIQFNFNDISLQCDSFLIP